MVTFDPHTSATPPHLDAPISLVLPDAVERPVHPAPPDCSASDSPSVDITGPELEQPEDYSRIFTFPPEVMEKLPLLHQSTLTGELNLGCASFDECSALVDFEKVTLKIGAAPEKARALVVLAYVLTQAVDPWTCTAAQAVIENALSGQPELLTDVTSISKSAAETCSAVARLARLHLQLP